MSLLPSSNDDVDAQQEGELRVFGVDDDETSEVLDALGSDTARTILSSIYSEPATPSELQERTGFSLQTISYHLSNLEDTGVVRVAGTEYSEKGREMNVYAPADEPIAVFVGTEDRKNSLVELVKRVLSSFTVLVLSTGYVFFRTAELSASPSGSGVFTAPFAMFFLGGLLVLYVFIAWGVWDEIRS
ncbi:ArsR/SmtB family transcription factor [Salarchaeum japonicum]|uniref:HTH arsR-type domain-containing protein n=1 Tax=Salarchaeum japonicum TaxID=555573 RepID=A0AAV3T3F4_9EURY|nr:winged helix-turn-helix domain-containing protein [Salarchaeum japonicum]